MVKNMNISKRYIDLRKSLPDKIDIVVAAKKRTAEEIREVIFAGAKYIGENYVQEALSVYNGLGGDADKVEWHMIGHLQRNKVKEAIKVFDMIESLDSLRLAEELNKRCKEVNKVMPVLVEINSGKEKQKTGILPENALDFIKKVSGFSNISVKGIMTMGPRFGVSEDFIPYFDKTKDIFNKIKNLNLSNVEMKYLSMGMTNSYKVAIELGSNMVRIGTAIFGER